MTTQGLDRQGSVDVLTGPWQYEGLPAEYWTARVAVVFDVLRATTTMAAWVAAGAAGIVPCRTVEEARVRAAAEGALLVGERDGVAPEGFDAGNSPREAVPRVAAGRLLVMTTTNGTRALAAAAGAAAVYAASLANASAMAARLQRDHGQQPWTLVLAGTGERFALEDAVGASWLLRLTGVASPWRGLTAGGAESIRGLLAASANGRRLAAHGLGADLDWCAVPDRLGLVLEQRGGLLAGS